MPLIDALILCRVFILLARKMCRLRQGDSVGAWACFVFVLDGLALTSGYTCTHKAKISSPHIATAMF